MKKLSAILVTSVMVLSSFTGVYAEDAKSFFEKANKETSKAISEEVDLIIKNDTYSQISKNLMTIPYDYKAELEIQSFKLPDLNLSNFKLISDSKVDLNKGKMLMKSTLGLPKLLTGMEKDVDLDVNVYFTKDTIAVNMPKVSDTYYYANSSDLTTKWSSSPIGQMIPLGKSEITQIQSVLNSMFNSSQLTNEILANVNGIEKPYTEIFKDTLSKAEFKFDGNEYIDYGGSLINSKKTSIIFKPEIANEMLHSMGNLVNTDNQLKSLLHTIYADSEKLVGYDITNNLITSLSQLLTTAELTEDLIYNIYTNDKGQIISNVFQYTMEDAGTFVFKFDTKGKNKLLNFIEITGEFIDTLGVSRGVNFISKGSIALTDGIDDTKMSLKVYEKGTDENSKFYRTDFFVCNLDLLLDNNKTADNFKLTMGADWSAMVGEKMPEEEFIEYGLNEHMTYAEYAGDIPDTKMTMDIRGSVNANLNRNTISYDMNSIRINLQNNIISLRFKSSYNPSNSADFDVTNLVDAIKLTDEQLQEIAAANLVSFFQ